MANKEHELEFEAVLSKLRAWREEIVVELHWVKKHNKAIEIKLQIDAAIDCLELGQRLQIRLGATVTVLPETRTRTPSSNYRVLEDHETEQRECWAVARNVASSAGKRETNADVK